MLSDGLVEMPVATQAEWMGIIEQWWWCVWGGGGGQFLQMAAVSMAAIKRWEVSGQG